MTLELLCPHCKKQIKINNYPKTKSCPMCLEIVDDEYFLCNFPFKVTQPEKEKTGKIRNRIMNRLQSFGFRTPDFGKISEISLRCDRGADLVVYLDHCVERVACEELRWKTEYYNKYCSVFYADKDKKENYKLTRVIYIGERGFVVVFKGNKWKIIKGNEIEVSLEFQLNGRKKHLIGDFSKIKIPVFSVDFVETEFGYLAIDFDIDVGIKRTGIGAFLSRDEAVKLIVEAIRK